MGRSPLVSVLLPCRDAEATLAEALASLQAQTFLDWETIVVDDGSRDASADIAETFSSQDRRIRVIRANPHGIVAALQRAAGEAQGEYLARMDADDVALPERLARQLALMRADPALALCGTGIRTMGDRVGLGRTRYEAWLNALVSHEDITRELFVECPLAHPTFFIRRTAYDSVGGYLDPGWAEDYDLCLRLFVHGGRFGKVPEPLLHWREAPGRLSMRDARYAEAAFRHAKRHYLWLTYLRDRPYFHQWGAGEVGKRWLREWGSAGPAAVVDINPAKIGRRIHGVRVILPEELPAPGDTFILVAVGAPGAREEIRAWFEPRGYRELADYLFLA